MGQIEIAVQGSKRLETLLETRFGAKGRGLHEKLTSVEKRIPEDVRKSIRWIATVRNKLVHEQRPAGFVAEDFARTVERVAQRLSSHRPQRSGRSRRKAEARRLRSTAARPYGRLVLAVLLMIGVGLAVALLARLR